jgi:hypothetical protein
MSQIPAVCKNCGLMFPSAAKAHPSITVKDSRTICPRCNEMAPILNGYTAIINGMMTFILSPDHSRETKQALINAALSVAMGEVRADEATLALKSKSEVAGKLLREWIVVGSTFVGAMATAATFLLAYVESGRNEPPEQATLEAVDNFLRQEPQRDKRTDLGPNISLRPPSFLEFQNNTKQGQANRTSAEAPNENRKSRRSRIAELEKKRPKSKK